ncbi:MAG: tetraacyldisaccharide 4'-kinase [Planctomycetes bacterium]|nr:tetraacyldisaccharide 4'-kinase [Planctomycetota bacterium]
MSGPLPAWLAPLTAPASWAYGVAVARRNHRYDRGEAARVARPVISVGNVTAGGAGKTPCVRWIARRLLAEGHRPVIAMRGYGARDGAASDEELEHRERLPEVPVVADPDRTSALRVFLPRHPEVDCVVLDDGFQHRRLHRDLDLVLVDATRDALDGRLLPRGYLREPVSALARADAVLVTRASGVDVALADRIAAYHGRPPLAWSRHEWSGLEVHDGSSAEHVDVEWLRERVVAVMLGVGNPGPVAGQVREAGAEIAVSIPVRDHQHYTPRFLRRVRSSLAGVRALVMTAKDWVKTRPLIDFTDWPVPIVVPRLDLDVFAGTDELANLILEAARSTTPSVP